MHLLTVLLAASAALAAPSTSSAPKECLGFYVAVQSSGIVDISFDPSQAANESLTAVSTTPNAGFMPGWVTSRNDKVYSISRTHFPDNSSVSGGVFAFQRPPSTNSPLQLLNTQSSNGEGGVYCEASPDGSTLAAANIDGNTVSIYPLSKKGQIGTATYVFHLNISQPGPGAGDSQLAANPHQSIFDPSGRFMFVPARGGDYISVYLVQGPSKVTQIQTIALPPGTGPRHITFQKVDNSKAYMYLVSELENMVRVFTVDYDRPQNVTATLRQTISTMAKGAGRTPPDNNDLASEVAVTNDGRFAYAANRNTQTLDSDTIAIFSVNNNTAHDANRLTFLGLQPTFGKTPRHFALSTDRDNRWLAVANEVTQDIIVFERDLGTGFMKGVVGNLSLGATDLSATKGPMCILWK